MLMITMECTTCVVQVISCVHCMLGLDGSCVLLLSAFGLNVIVALDTDAAAGKQ